MKNKIGLSRRPFSLLITRDTSAQSHGSCGFFEFAAFIAPRR
jgi:hypothetical protein